MTSRHGHRSPDSLGAAGAVPVALVDAIRSGDNEALVYLAEEAVARYSGIETQLGSERYFLYRVLRALDLSNLLIAVMASQRSEHPDSSEFELRQLRDEVRHRIDRPPPVARCRRSQSAGHQRRPARSAPSLMPRRVEDIDVARRLDDRAQRRARRGATACPQAGQSRRPAASPPSSRQPRRAAHDPPFAGCRRHPPRPGLAQGTADETAAGDVVRHVGVGRRVRPLHADAAARHPRPSSLGCGRSCSSTGWPR